MKIPMVAGKAYGALTVAKPDKDGQIAIIRPHPSAPTSTIGNVVARVGFATYFENGVNTPTEETEAYARLFAAAPELLTLVRYALDACAYSSVPGKVAQVRELLASLGVQL